MFLRPPSLKAAAPAECQSQKAVTLEEAERDHIRKTLEHTRWVVAGPNGAAARLRVHRSTLYYRLQKLGIERPLRKNHG
jgi:formate hydrogenlyase transcriptional activator